MQTWVAENYSKGEDRHPDDRKRKKTTWKSGSQRNEVDTMVDYCTDISVAVVILNAAAS